jgi:hypothetical protein
MNSLPPEKPDPHHFCPNDAQRALKSALPLPLAVAPQTIVFSFAPPPSDHSASYRKKLAQKIQAFVI